MATASLDCSVKIWDLEAILDQQVPPVGGLHYVVLSAGGSDADFRYFASNRGWGVSCQLSRATTTVTAGNLSPSWEAIGTASSHRGFIEVAVFTLEATRLVTVDLGHCGQYTVRTSGQLSPSSLWLSRQVEY